MPAASPTPATEIGYQESWPASMPRAPPRSAFRYGSSRHSERRKDNRHYVRAQAEPVANWHPSCIFSLDIVATARYNFVNKTSRSRKVLQAPYGP